MCWMCRNREKLEMTGLTNTEINEILQDDVYYLTKPWNRDIRFEPLNKFLGPNGPAILKAYRIRKGKT